MGARQEAAMSPPCMSCVERVEQVFTGCFGSSLRTRLQGGAAEPLYQPAAKAGDFHVLHYRADYFASALHEVAHWCIAGEIRRQQTDFGYWYAPDGRSPAQQRAFERVECRPQALEWYFSKACAHRFRLSMDNLQGIEGDVPHASDFARSVYAQALQLQRSGLPARAAAFFQGLCREFDTPVDPADLQFTMEELN